jgi:hypothetical protein
MKEGPDTAQADEKAEDESAAATIAAVPSNKRPALVVGETFDLYT